MHLTVEIYRLMLRGVLEPWQLVEVAHHHAVEECDQCRQELEQLGLDGDIGPWAGVPPRPGDGQGGTGRELILPPQPEDPDALSIADLEVWKDLVSRMRAETRKAREDVRQLLELPPEERWDRVENAKTRFQSRAFAQLLLRESRTRVRNEPTVAAQLAALVPVALDWAPDDSSWARALRARAEAYRANAERVAGDLPDAARRFAALRRRLEQDPLADTAALAEIDSLEASLCIDRRRFQAARRLLATAAERARGAGHRHLLQRILIQTANLHGAQGNPERQLAALEAAARELDTDDASYEHLCLVTSQVLALCDLERFDRAAERLERAEPLFEGQEHAEATLAGLRGRLALVRGSWREAVERFGAARAAFLTLGRHYDAALTTLDLAHAHLAAGDTARLRELAAGLTALFETREVERETLAVLRLLAEAVASDRAGVDLVVGLRRRLEQRRS